MLSFSFFLSAMTLLKLMMAVWYSPAITAASPRSLKSSGSSGFSTMALESLVTARFGDPLSLRALACIFLQLQKQGPIYFSFSFWNSQGCYLGLHDLRVCVWDRVQGIIPLISRLFSRWRALWRRPL